MCLIWQPIYGQELLCSQFKNAYLQFESRVEPKLMQELMYSTVVQQ